MKRPRCHKAFTGAELIVVTAGFMVVGAVLAPVFIRARENAKRAACLSNMKQIGLAIAMYSQDYDQIYPRPSQRWISVELQPYVKNLAPFSCPSVSHQAAPTFDYGLNRNIAGLAQGTMSASSFSTTAAIFESAPKVQGREAVGTPNSGDRPVRDRHLGGANFGYADAHVKWTQSYKPLETEDLTFTAR